MISQCNVMLPDAVRKMPKLERLVSVWQQLLQLTDCLAGLHRGPAGRGYRALRQSELLSGLLVLVLGCRRRALHCLLAAARPKYRLPLLRFKSWLTVAFTDGLPFAQFVTSTPVTQLVPGAYCKSMRHLCVDWDVAFESREMLAQCAGMEVRRRLCGGATGGGRIGGCHRHLL